MAQVKINKEIHVFIKKLSFLTGLKMEKIIDSILRPWYEKKKKEEEE